MKRLFIFFSLITIITCDKDNSLDVNQWKSWAAKNNIGFTIVDKENHQFEDFSKFWFSAIDTIIFKPDTTEKAGLILKKAHKENTRVRIKGRGHSMNRSSLPVKNEIVLVTEKLNHYTTKSKESIIVGSGVTLYSLNHWLKQRGYQLPVENDGMLGPSVGGFIAAGGIGTASKKYGGFWNNVKQVTMINNEGKVETLTPGHKKFNWLFGSMGKLGLITEAELSIVKSHEVATSKYTLNESGNIEEYWQKDPTEKKAHEQVYKRGGLYWFTLIAPAGNKDRLIEILKNIESKHSATLRYIPNYIWHIKKGNFTPPLIYPQHTDLVCVGIWGYARDKDKTVVKEKVMAIESDIMQVIKENPAIRRYIQSEPVSEHIDYQDYFGQVWVEFEKIDLH